MAIQPIDLQTLYSQMDKVSKNVVQQQQHVQLHNSMELDGLVKKDIQKNEKIEKTSEKEGPHCTNELPLLLKCLLLLIVFP